MPPRFPLTTARRPRRPRRASRRHVSLHQVAFVCVTLFGLAIPPGVANAADPVKPSTAGEARDRRDQVRREQAEIASQLKPLEATEDELEQALTLISTHVQAQQRRVSDTSKAAEDAGRLARDLADEVRGLEVGIRDLEYQVRERAIAAYVAPGGRNSNEELLLRSQDLTTAERQRALLSEVNGSDADSRDRLRSQRLRLADIRVQADGAAVESAEKRAEAEDELKVLAEAHEQQRVIKAAIDQRIADYKIHAMQLLKEDADLEKIITNLTYRTQVQANGPPRNAEIGTDAAGNVVRTVGPGGMIAPMAGRLTQGFGGRGGHPGIDVAAPMNTPIYAAKGGEVIFAGWNNGGYGNLVMIDHGDGIITAYAHQNRVGVSMGQEVVQGQLIGYEGTTGYSTGPHLHFEVRIGGGKANPFNYIPG